MIKTEKVTVTTTGVDGSAEGTADTRRPLCGELVAVYVDYITQPATTDVTIATKNAPVKTLLTLTSANTDGWFYPRYVVHGETGTALTGTAGGDRTRHPIDDYVTVTVAQGDDPGSVDVYLLIEC
jgi:hypothetical protein